MTDEKRSETSDATPPDAAARVVEALQDLETAQSNPKSGFGPRERSSTLNDTVLAEALRQMNQARRTRRSMRNVTDTELAELERRASDSRDPASQYKAQQRLTELVAAEITGQRSKEYALYDIRIGNETFVLQRDEKEQLVKQANLTRLSIQQCPRRDSSKGIRCDCCESFKRWYWSLQEGPLQQVASALWDKLDTFARQT